MRKNIFENRNLGITTALISILLLFTGGFVVLKNHSLKNQLRESKIKTETLVSESLSLTKSSEKLKADVNNLQGRIKILEETLSATNMKIAGKEAEINKLKRQNANAAVLNQKIKELDQLKSDQEEQIADLNQKIVQLNQKNSELSAMMDELQLKNTTLTQNYQVLYAMEGNNYRVEALRGEKEKLMIRARRTTKIVVNLDVPSESVQNIKFKVKTPADEEFSSAMDKNVSVNTSKVGPQAETIKINDQVINMSKIELTFKPEKKLEKGIYSFDIYNNELYAGTTQIRLR